MASHSIGRNIPRAGTMGRNVTLSMAGREYGKGATLSRGCSARAYEAAEGRATVPTMRTRILNPATWFTAMSQKPRIAPGPLLSKIHPLDKEFHYLLPLFGAAMLSGSTLPCPDGVAASPFFEPLRVPDPVVIPFSCFVFLPEVAPGPTFPSLDAPGAGWL